MKTLAQYPFLKPCFWSYRLEDLDIVTHKTLIIKQVLNYGAREATVWLRATYTPEEISEVISASMESEWVKKSLVLWSLVYQTQPARASRFA